MLYKLRISCINIWYAIDSKPIKNKIKYLFLKNYDMEITKIKAYLIIVF